MEKRIARLEQKAWTFVGLGDAEPALAAFDAALDLAPNNLNLMLSKGVALFKLGSLASAAEHFGVILEKHPDNTTALNNKARVHVELGEETEALGCYKRILKLDADHVKTWHRAGELMTRLERYDKALGLLSTALELDPNDADIWHSRAIALWRSEAYDDASAHFAHAIQLRPKRVEGWRDRGRMQRERGRVEEAIEDLTKALSLTSDDTEAQVELGRALLDAERADDAHTIFHALVEQDVDCHQGWEGRGMALTLKGEVARGALNRGTACMIRGDHEEAIAFMDEALEHDAEYGQAWSNKGVVHERMQAWELAVECYEMALQIDEDAVVVMHNLGMLLIAHLERRDEGLGWLRESIKREPKRWFELPSELRRGVDELGR